MAHGAYRRSLLSIRDEKQSRRPRKGIKCPQARARFYRGQDLNICISDLESLGALHNAAEQALEQATAPQTGDQFRALTLRVVRGGERVTVSLAGYVCKRPKKNSQKKVG